MICLNCWKCPQCGHDKFVLVNEEPKTKRCPHCLNPVKATYACAKCGHEETYIRINLEALKLAVDDPERRRLIE